MDDPRRRGVESLVGGGDQREWNADRRNSGSWEHFYVLNLHVIMAMSRRIVCFMGIYTFVQSGGGFWDIETRKECHFQVRAHCFIGEIRVTTQLPAPDAPRGASIPRLRENNCSLTIT